MKENKKVFSIAVFSNLYLFKTIKHALPYENKYIIQLQYSLCVFVKVSATAGKFIYFFIKIQLILSNLYLAQMDIDSDVSISWMNKTGDNKI